MYKIFPYVLHFVSPNIQPQPSAPH